jgi:hypothetical protein
VLSRFVLTTLSLETEFVNSCRFFLQLRKFDVVFGILWFFCCTVRFLQTRDVFEGFFATYLCFGMLSF